MTKNASCGRAAAQFNRGERCAGSERHQSPCVALGVYTMLERNMCFSEETGLYDPEHKCGFNWSDTIVVGTKSGYRISRVLLYERLVLDHLGKWCLRYGASDQVIDRLIRPMPESGCEPAFFMGA